jgi:hypothetical protein
MTEDARQGAGLPAALHEVFFALNIGFAVPFAVLMFAYGRATFGPPARFFLEPAVEFLINHATKLNRSLHLYYGSDAGYEITACASILLIALAVFLILRVLGRTAMNRALLYPIGGLSAMALLPALYEHVLQSTWWIYGGSLYPFRRSGQLSFSALEMSLILAFFLLARNWRHRVWVGAVVLTLHYTLWTGQLWWTFHRIPLLGPKLLYFVFPCSGFVWLFYTRTLPGTGWGR